MYELRIPGTLFFLPFLYIERAYQGWIFELANIILKVDFSLIESRISILWPYMLNVTILLKIKKKGNRGARMKEKLNFNTYILFLAAKGS